MDKVEDYLKRWSKTTHYADGQINFASLDSIILLQLRLQYKLLTLVESEMQRLMKKKYLCDWKR